MPRTKRPAPRRAERAPDPAEAEQRRALGAMVEQHKKALDNCCEMEIRQIEVAFRIMLNAMSEETKNKTIGQLKSEICLKEPLHNSTMNHTMTRPASHDDGYLTETSQGSGDRGTGTRRRTSRSATRHADMSGHSSTASRPTSRRRSRSADQSALKSSSRPPRSAFKMPSSYKTPMCNKNSGILLPPITPKVTANTPFTKLRQPRQGEIFYSMTGSPLVAPVLPGQDKADSDSPQGGTTMFTAIIQQLRTLTANVETVANLRVQD